VGKNVKNMQIEKLKGIIPEVVLSELGTILKTRAISNRQLAAFLAQVAHESGNFKRVTENLNYSAEGLVSTFKGIFNGVADKYHRKPEMIANRAYANKGGNGSEASGDGWKYRGMGYIQLTLKNNYIAFDATIPDDITNNPDLVATKYPLASAFWYFDANKLWVLAGSESPNSFELLTGKINKAKLGLSERVKYFNKYLKALG
jgi:putative chitinase